MSPTVRIVVVSHSAALAQGVLDLARQMAPDVDLVAAGGTDDGELGTSFDRIAAALADAPAGGVVVLYDLGSALLTTETALEFLEPDAAAMVDVVDAPLVEGALAAATAAQGGGDRAAVVSAAVAAGGTAASDPAADLTDAAVRTVITLRNPLGLHARPAAEVARALAGLDADVTVGAPGGPTADLRSVLGVVALALRGGAEVRVSASGPDAQRAVDAATDLISTGFGEAGAPRDIGGTSEPRQSEAGENEADNRDTGAGGPRPGATGRAIGPLVHAGAIEVPTGTPTPDEADAQSRRLADAMRSAAAELRAGDELAQVRAAMLDDDALRAPALAAVSAGASAERAWWDAVCGVADSLAGDADDLVAGRAADVREAGAAVLRELGVAASRLPADVAGRVLAAPDLGPGELGDFAARGGAAVVLAAGTATAHAVIVARGLGLPVVLRAGTMLDGVPDGTTVAVDGDAGTVDVDPEDAMQLAAEIDSAARDQDAELAAAAAPVQVRGRAVVVAANISSPADARAAVRFGADAVGLLRTELLVLDRATLPDEDAQTDDLREILAVLHPRPVVVRVLDAGGDKPVRASRLDPAHNGFLGVRGLRWLLANPDVLHTQLRAICRAAGGHRVAVMAPMVTVAAEMRAFRRAVDAAVDSLVADGTPHARPDAVGAMIEVPAAALAADEIADVADFLSVGTNDLTSYTMAADRTEAGVADLLDPRATALWRLLGIVADAAAGRADLAVCGELAAVPEFAERLVALGFGELSAAPAAIPALKRYLRSLG